MRKQNLYRQKIVSSEYMYVAFYPLLGTVNFVTVGSSIILNQVVAGSIMGRHMKMMIVLSLPLRMYCNMRSTHNACQGVIMTSLVLVHDHTFGCVSCFWQDLQDLTNDRMVLCIPFQYIIDLVVSSRCEWLGCWR